MDFKNVILFGLGGTLSLLLQSCGKADHFDDRSPTEIESEAPSTATVEELALQQGSGQDSYLIPSAQDPKIFNVQLIPRSSDAWRTPRGLIYRRVVNWKDIRRFDGYYDSRNYAACGEAVYNGDKHPELKGKIIAYVERIDVHTAYNKMSRDSADGYNHLRFNWPPTGMRSLRFVGRCSYLYFSTMVSSHVENPDVMWSEDKRCRDCEPIRFQGGSTIQPYRNLADEEWLQFRPRSIAATEFINKSVNSYSYSSRDDSTAFQNKRIYGAKVAKIYNRFTHDPWSKAGDWLTILEPTEYRPIPSLGGWECAESPYIHFPVARIRQTATKSVAKQPYIEILGSCSDYQFLNQQRLANGLTCINASTNPLLGVRALILDDSGKNTLIDRSCENAYPTVDGVMRSSSCVGIVDYCGDPTLPRVADLGSFAQSPNSRQCRDLVWAHARSCMKKGSAFLPIRPDTWMIHDNQKQQVDHFNGCLVTARSCRNEQNLSGVPNKLYADSMDQGHCINAARKLVIDQCGNPPGERHVDIRYGGMVLNNLVKKDQYRPEIRLLSPTALGPIKTMATMSKELEFEVSYPADDDFGTVQDSFFQSDAKDWKLRVFGIMDNKISFIPETQAPQIEFLTPVSRSGFKLKARIHLLANTKRGAFDQRLVLESRFGPIANRSTVDTQFRVSGSIVPSQPAWQNTTQALDVNNDGYVNATDALAIINELRRNGPRELDDVGPVGDRKTFFDVNGDGFLNSTDSLAVINRLRGL